MIGYDNLISCQLASGTKKQKYNGKERSNGGRSSKRFDRKRERKAPFLSLFLYVRASDCEKKAFPFLERREKRGIAINNSPAKEKYQMFFVVFLLSLIML